MRRVRHFDTHVGIIVNGQLPLPVDGVKQSDIGEVIRRQRIIPIAVEIHGKTDNAGHGNIKIQMQDIVVRQLPPGPSRHTLAGDRVDLHILGNGDLHAVDGIVANVHHELGAEFAEILAEIDPVLFVGVELNSPYRAGTTVLDAHAQDIGPAQEGNRFVALFPLDRSGELGAGERDVIKRFGGDADLIE